MGLGIYRGPVDILLFILILDANEGLHVFRLQTLPGLNCRHLLLDIYNQKRDDHEGSNSNNNNPDDFLPFLLILIDILHLNPETKVTIRIVCSDVYNIRFGDVFDSKGDILVDLELGNVVAIHVCEQECVHAMGVEGKGYLVCVEDPMHA